LENRSTQDSLAEIARKQNAKSFELRATSSDQGQLGSCTANGIAGAIEFDQIKQKVGEFVPSRLFIYYNERTVENTVLFDAGAQIRDGIKSVASLGVCPENNVALQR
jgi:C1A family cysteine protease